MIVWNGMDLIELIILIIFIIIMLLGCIASKVFGGFGKRRQKRWERVLKEEKKKVTCYGCKHLWMSNIGTYECIINKEKACIDNKANKRYLYEASENREVDHER